MLAIRLTRTGKTHAPHYRIVVQEKRSKLNGKAVDIIGHYHPAQKEKLLVVDKEKAQKWLSLGAQPSDTVTNLLVKEGILDKSRTVHNFFTPTAKVEKPAKEEKAAKAEAEVAEEEAAPAEEVAVEETPAEETPATEEAATEEVTPEEPATEEAPVEEPAAEAVETEEVAK